MAAETALFLTYGHNGIIGIGDACGSTMELLGNLPPELGIPTRLILGSTRKSVPMNRLC